MKKRLLFLSALFIWNGTRAQINMSNSTIELNCTNVQTYYDVGGPSGPYTAWAGNTQTFTTNNPLFPVSVSFSYFDVEGWDDLIIFDGPNTLSPVIGYFDNNNVPGTITSSHPTGALTLQLLQGDDISGNGWVASLTGGTGNPALSILTTDETCNYANDGSLNLIVSNNDGPYTYSWSNGATTEDLTNLPQGVYSVMVTSASNCVASDVAMVNEPAAFAVTVSVSNGLSIVSSNASSYQWINCTTGAEIVGATGQTMVASSNGEYAVIGTSSTGCVDTSNCVLIDYVEVSDLNELALSISPNPTDQDLKVVFDGKQAHLSIYDAFGKIVHQSNIVSGTLIDLSTFETGVYLFELTSEKGVFVQRVVRN